MQPLIPATAGGLIFASAWTTVGLVLLWIAAGLGALLTLLLLIPIHVRANGGVDDVSLTGRAKLRWAWGVISVRMIPSPCATLHLVGLRIWTFRGKGSDHTPDDEPRTPRKRAKRWFQWLLRHRHTGLRLAKRMIRTLRLQMRLQGELGLGDPAATALLNQLLWQLNRMSPSVSVQVEPDWLDERVQLDGEVEARIWLAHMGLVLLGGLLHRETRQMIRTVPRAGR